MPFSELDLDQVQRETFVEQIEFHERISSTNDRALKLAAEEPGCYPLPLLVVANSQTDGRGRGTNRWWASEGSLAFSLLLEPGKAELPPSCWPQVSLHVGLAVCEAIEELLGDRQPRLKWPNDVYLESRKMCGVLVEVPSVAPRMLVVGIGVNVNNTLANAPAELAGSAIALCEVAGRDFSLATVLTRLLVHISEILSWIGTRDEELRQRWRARCMLTDRYIQLDLGTRRIQGVCQGIDDQGALIIQTNEGIDRCFGGVVTHF